MFAQLLEGQTELNSKHDSLSTYLNSKYDSLYTDINIKIDILRSHISELSSPSASINAVTLHSRKQLNPILQRESSAQTSSIPVAGNVSVSIDTSGCQSTPITLDDSVLPFSSGINIFREEEIIPMVSNDTHHLRRSTPTILQEKSSCEKARSTWVDTYGVERHPPHVDRHQHQTDSTVLTFDIAGLIPDSGVVRHSPSVDRHWTQTPPICLASPPVTRQVFTPLVPCLLHRQSKQEIPEMHCMGIMDETLL